MKKVTAVRTRHPKATTRATILAKAYEMYLDRRLIHGDERLSHVLDELGYTTGAGYQIWANQAAFRRDLQIYVAENIAYANPELVAADVERVLASAESADEASLHVADLYFAAMVGVKQFYLTLRFLGMAEDRPEEITETLSDAYERSSWEVNERLENGLVQLKRRMRDGLTVEALGIAVTALLEGYALRHGVQAEKTAKTYDFDGRSHTGFAIAYLGLVNQFTEPVDA